MGPPGRGASLRVQMQAFQGRSIRDKAPGAVSVTRLCLAALWPCCLPTFCVPASSLKGGQNGTAEAWGLRRKDRPHRRCCRKALCQGGAARTSPTPVPAW